MSKLPTSLFAKIVIFFAVAFGIGVGLCGLDYFLATHNIGRSHEEFGVGPLDGPSILVMFFSALGLVVSLIAWFIAAIVFGITHSSDPPQTLFHPPEEKPSDDDSR